MAYVTALLILVVAATSPLHNIVPHEHEPKPSAETATHTHVHNHNFTHVHAEPVATSGSGEESPAWKSLHSIALMQKAKDLILAAVLLPLFLGAVSLAVFKQNPTLINRVIRSRRLLSVFVIEHGRLLTKGIVPYRTFT